MKNAFTKVLAVLTMCFLICAVIVSCGKKEPEISVSEDGYLVVDGVKTEYKVEGSEESTDSCAHQMVEVEIEKHTATSEGKILEFCEKCLGEATTKSGTKHNIINKVTKEATCSEDGSMIEVCSICDKEMGASVIPMIPHAWSEDIALSDTSEPACSYSAVSVKMCSYCLILSDPMVVEPVGHTSEKWTVSVVPTLETAGEADGVCIYCKENIAYELPALDDGEEGSYSGVWSKEKLDEEGTLGEELKATCSKTGMKVYTYVPSGELDDNNVSDANIEFYVESVVPCTEHLLNGKFVSEYLKDGVYPYYDDLDGDGALDVVGFVELYLSGISCGTQGEGYFICDDCEKSFKIMNLYKSHYGEESVLVEATCHTPGTKVLACENCEQKIESAYYANHEYEYELVDDKDGDDSTWNLVGKCMNVKKTLDAEGKEISSVECWNQGSASDKSLVGFFEKSIVAEKTETVSPTCYMPGYDVWTYKWEEDGVECSADAQVALDSDGDGVLDLLPHTLDGKLADEYEVFTFDIPGVSLRGDLNVDKCDVEYPAQFQCSVCAAYKAETNANIQTMIEIVAIRPHDKSYDEARSSEATCTTDGGKAFICKYPGCELSVFDPNINDEAYKAKYIEVIPATGHDFECSYVVDAENKKFNVTCKCKNEGCDVEVKADALISDFAFAEKELPRESCTDPQIFAYEAVIVVNVNEADGSFTLKDGKDGDENAIVVRYEVVDEEFTSHKFCEEEFYKTVKCEKDLDRDGNADVVDKFVLKYCVRCLTVEIVSRERIEIEE